MIIPAPRPVSSFLRVSCCLLVLGSSGLAQVVTLNPADGANLPPDDRQRLYAEVAREVAVLEQHGNLLKKVVKLVRPTVVHLEALKSEIVESRYQRRPAVEEAGSGVVIELEGDYYILTNRHVITHTTIEHIRIRLSDGRHLTAAQSLGRPGHGCGGDSGPAGGPRHGSDWRQ